MAHPMRRKVAAQVAIQLLEADVDIGFALLDEAVALRAFGQPELSARVLREAADVVAEIERRLEQLDVSESAPFQPLIAELRSQLARAQPKAS